MALNVMEDQGRRQVNHLVTRDKNICAANANNATPVSKLWLRSRPPQSAQPEVTGVISAINHDGPLHNGYKAIKEGFRGRSFGKGVAPSQVTYRTYVTSPC